MWILAILRLHSLLSAKWTSNQGSGSLIMMFKAHLKINLFDMFPPETCEATWWNFANKWPPLPKLLTSIWLFSFLLWPVQLCHGPLTFNIQEVLHVRLWSGPPVHQHYWGSSTSKYISRSIFPFLQLIRNGKVLWFCLFCCQCAWLLYCTAFSAVRSSKWLQLSWGIYKGVIVS